MLEVGEAFAEAFSTDMFHQPTNSTINAPPIITTLAAMPRPKTSNEENGAGPPAIAPEHPQDVKISQDDTLLEVMVSWLLASV